MKKFLVVTMTCGRIDVSQKYVPTLKEKAGHPYFHVIVDNGSTDGTADWFEENGYEVVRNSENVGVMQGWIDGYNYALETGFEPDYVIRMDDDCEVETDGILKKIKEFYEECGDNFIVAPRNVTLTDPRYMPKKLSEQNRIGKWNVRISSHAGLFVCAPREAFDGLARVGGAQHDAKRGRWWSSQGFINLYLMDLKVHHRGRNTSNRKPGEYRY